MFYQSRARYARNNPEMARKNTRARLAVLKTAAKGTMSCTGGAGSPRLGTHPAPRPAAHDDAAHHCSPTVAHARKLAGAGVRR